MILICAGAVRAVSSKAIALMPFRDVQNIDEETSKHWKRWLGAEN
jgi:hypothetical protein